MSAPLLLTIVTRIATEEAREFKWCLNRVCDDLNRFKFPGSLRGSLERLRALQTVSDLAVAEAGAMAVVVAVLVAVIKPLVVAGCRVIRK